MSYVFMKVLESAPRRYDFGIRLLSLGRINRVHREMAEWGASEGARALDIGCGTGSLALVCARPGAQVTGVISAGVWCATRRWLRWTFLTLISRSPSRRCPLWRWPTP